MKNLFCQIRNLPVYVLVTQFLIQVLLIFELLIFRLLIKIQFWFVSFSVKVEYRFEVAKWWARLESELLIQARHAYFKVQYHTEYSAADLDPFRYKIYIAGSESDHDFYDFCKKSKLKLQTYV